MGRILAEPHLLANSGQEAKFLEGGEIPIVMAQALNTSVVFKQYGTSVIFIPTVVGKRDIELVVKPEVSQPDFAAGVQMFGFTDPGLRHAARRDRGQNEGEPDPDNRRAAAASEDPDRGQGSLPR